MFFQSKLERNLERQAAAEIAIEQAEVDLRLHERCSAETIYNLLGCAVVAQDLGDAQGYQLAFEGICEAYEGRRSARQCLQALSGVKLEISTFQSTETTAQSLASSTKSVASLDDVIKLVSATRIADAKDSRLRIHLQAAIDDVLRREGEGGGVNSNEAPKMLIAQEKERRRIEGLSRRLAQLDELLERLEARKAAADKLGQGAADSQGASQPFQVEIVPASYQKMGKEGVREFHAALPFYRQTAVDRWRNDGRYKNLKEGSLPKSDEQAKVFAFMRNRFAALGAKALPPEVAYSTFNQVEGSAAGHGVARYRWAAVLSSLKPSERLSVMVHEFSHAVAYVRLRFSENPSLSPWAGDTIATGTAKGLITPVREGWVHHVTTRTSPFPPARFMIFEEFAACAHEAAWYRSEGWTEKLLLGAILMPITKEKQWQIALARAARWLESPDRGAADDARCRASDGLRSLSVELDGKTLVVPYHGTIFEKGGRSFRAGYSHYRAAAHLLAPELYPDKTPEAYLTALEDDLCRVQAGIMAPTQFVRRLKAQFGHDAAWFFAHLQNDNGLGPNTAVGPSSLFLGALAESARLGSASPTGAQQKKRVREMLFQGLRLYIESCRA